MSASTVYNINQGDGLIVERDGKVIVKITGSTVYVYTSNLVLVSGGAAITELKAAGDVDVHEGDILIHKGDIIIKGNSHVSTDLNIRGNVKIQGTLDVNGKIMTLGGIDNWAGLKSAPDVPPVGPPPEWTDIPSLPAS